MSNGQNGQAGGSQTALVAADLSCKIPGRGAWVAAKRSSVIRAIKSGALNRAAKANVEVPADFDGLIEKQLALRVLSMLGMANRAGALESGFDKVRSAASEGALALRFEASDGTPDGRSKIRVLTKALAKSLQEHPVYAIGCFDAKALGKLIGRDHCVHLAVRKGGLANALHLEISRLSGFRALIPQDWPDKSHEPEFIPFGD